MMDRLKPSLYLKGLSHALAKTTSQEQEKQSIDQLAQLMHHVLYFAVSDRTYNGARAVDTSWAITSYYAASLGIQKKEVNRTLQEVLDARLYDTCLAKDASELSWYTSIEGTLELVRREIRSLYTIPEGRALPDICKNEIARFRAKIEEAKLRSLDADLKNLLNDLIVENVGYSMRPSHLYYLPQFIDAYVRPDLVYDNKITNTIEMLGGYDTQCPVYRLLEEMRGFNQLLQSHMDFPCIADLKQIFDGALEKTMLYAHMCLYLRWRIRHLSSQATALLQGAEIHTVDE